MSVVLYDYWRSSAAYRLRIALNLLGLDWQSVPVNLLIGDHRKPDNLARNPQGLVPTVEIDGLTLTQSLAILEYLNETNQAGWLPEDAVGKAKVRALAYAIAMEIHPVCNLSVAKYAAENSNGGITMESWMNMFISKGLIAYEKMLDASGQYSYGDKLTMADFCLVPQLYNADRWGIGMSEFPRTAEIGCRLAEIPAVAAAHPDKVKREGS